MDPITNPFAPGAGTPPPELAGRDDLREAVRVAIERVRRGLPAKSTLMVGLRVIAAREVPYGHQADHRLGSSPLIASTILPSSFP